VARLLERGDRVVVSWRSREEADRLESAVSSPERMTLIEADVTDPDAVATLARAVQDGHGRLDALCNLVGGFAAGRLEETDPATWGRMMALNATSAFLVTRAVLPLLRDSGRGRVVSVAALPAIEHGANGMAAYAAAKAAVVNLTQSLAREALSDGVAVNAVAPSILDTEDNRRARPDADRSTWLPTGEVAAVIDFLTGPAAGIVTGNVLALRRG
jgi:NAD(P)-dependent dehydrogenase (short-subunit alcohol dehydrogenase family)